MNRLTFFQLCADKSPENSQGVYETNPCRHKREIKIIKYPDDILLHAIAEHHGGIAEEVTRGLINVISTAHYQSDFFCMIMYNDSGEVIGCANFIQSSSEPSKWFYTDLWVASEYRRQGCATEIVNAGWQHLSEHNARTLLCTVEPHNEASLILHRSLGFEQIETQPFEDFEVDGQIMFKMTVPQNFNIVSLTDDFNYLAFICDLLTHPSNVSALHLRKIPANEYSQFYKEMREALIFDSPEDELNYIIRKGVVPIGWLKLNGLSDDSLWISMLIVHEKYKNLGAAIFALNFVEEFALSTQRGTICINTTSDNIIAQSLCMRAGYTVVKKETHQNEDETTSDRLTFHKEIFDS